MKKLKLSEKEKEYILKDIKEQLNTCSKLEDIQIKYDLLNKAQIKQKDKPPKIYITAESLLKMQILVDTSDIEISWHGMVERNLSNNTYTIYDILLFPQLNTATSTTTDQDEYSRWMTELLSNPDFKIEDLRMHGHSHVDMPVYCSAVDDQYQKDLLKQIKDGDYYLFLILNKKRELCALLYDYNAQILYETKDLYINIIDQDGKLLRDNVLLEMACKCKKKTTPKFASEYYNRRNFIKGGKYGLK